MAAATRPTNQLIVERLDRIVRELAKIEERQAQLANEVRKLASARS